MNMLKPTFGTRVDIPDIEKTLESMWRQTVDASDEIPITKASTVNLVMLVRNEEHFYEIAQDIAFLIEHHPGRFILIFVDGEKQDEQLEAHVSFFCQYFKKLQSKTCCDLITLRTGALAEELLPGIIIPLLMPDLPVVFWCPDSCEMHPHMNNVLKYADRIITSGLQSISSFKALVENFAQLTAVHQNNSVSDLRWSDLAAWREAIAQLFDSPMSRSYLEQITALELYMQDEFDAAALYLPAWLANQLNWQFTSLEHSQQSIDLKFKRGDTSISVHVEKSNTSELIIYTGKENGSTIFKIIEKENVLKSVIEKDGQSNTVNYINQNNYTLLEKMCAELDYQENDPVFQSMLTKITEILYEANPTQIPG